ncbi:MAG: U32 family peptidase [Rhodobiaceae bacterium]|nr:U32 family peptidase [Rhodobiaceae bacterium]
MAKKTDGVQLTLGPVAYHWSEAKKRDFYARIADEAPIGTVYLGEVICSKRAPFFERAMPAVIDRLKRGGKRVVLSTLAEVVLPRERKATAALCRQEDFEIEINNAAGLYARSGKPHRIGPFMNAYNEATIAWMGSQGATHVCLPPELPGASFGAAAAAASAAGLETEAQVFGRAPLAVSARCYHARAHERHKDNCQFVCENDPDGMPLTTLEGERFLRINGIQTQSETYLCLAGEVPDIIAMGIRHLRLLPQDVDMVAVARTFHALACGALEPMAALDRIGELCAGTRMSNGFFHRAAGERYIAPEARTRVLV